MNQRKCSLNPANGLIQRAQEGCQESLGQLLEIYRPYFLKIAEDTLASDLRPKIGASDIVQGSLALAARRFEQ
ncbi:MAG: hypothetical protein AAF483_22465, partial [Planctomycetota bacterium]